VSTDLPLRKIAISEKARVESLKLPKLELSKQIMTVDLKGTRVDRSWKSGRACSREEEEKEADLSRRSRRTARDHKIDGRA
jgi:hypothetical protein